MKLDDLIAAIKPLAEREYRTATAKWPSIAKDYEPTPQRLMFLACRFCAWMDYRGMVDCNNREWINLFQEGFSGYKQAADVDGWLETIDPADDLKDSLMEFMFGERG